MAAIGVGPVSPAMTGQTRFYLWEYVVHYDMNYHNIYMYCVSNKSAYIAMHAQ